MKYSQAKVNEVIQMYKDGILVRDICRNASISPATLYTFINESNTPYRGTRQGAKKTERDNEIRFMYYNNTPVKTLCKKFNITKARLYQILKGDTIRVRTKTRKPKSLV